MSELDELRRKKLALLQKQHHQQLNADTGEQEQFAEQIGMLESMVRQCMSKEAWSRYTNIKAADPERAVQILAVLGQLMQARQGVQITDEQFRLLLMKLTPQKRETKIRRV